MITQIIIPINGDGILSGSIAKHASPNPLVISAVIIQGLYPILSTTFAQIKSTTNCVKKNVVDMIAKLPKDIL